ncbi:hypothetical protein EVAR_15842_1 [Eumeta japonica]|uniref:Uncharacterized protein n=1 Tax=Eumeta variegata TaxID=151549 RepID=A0A4C1UFA7_EUMVA|nr:hypothetical protein EVAR_15842_1 [Eumeta japonica]
MVGIVRPPDDIGRGRCNKRNENARGRRTIGKGWHGVCAALSARVSNIRRNMREMERRIDAKNTFENTSIAASSPLS